MKAAGAFPRHEELQAAPLADVRRALEREPAAARKPQPMLDAARARRADVLRLLLERGGDPNSIYRGYRPLHSLIQREPHADPEELSPERLACVEVLLKAGADPELPAAWPPVRATLLAALSNEPELLARLLERGARKDALVEAVQGRPGALKRALARDPAYVRAPENGGLLPLHAVAGSRLGRGAPRAARGLLTAAEALLDAGADPNAKVRSWSHDVDPAYFAVGARSPAMLELLLARGASPESALASALWADPEILGTLALAHGADPNATRMEERPALNELVRWGQVEPALWLLARGADPDLADARGWTALHQAVSRGNERLVRALLAAGGHRDARDEEGRTPLALARAKGRAKLVALLQPVS